MNTTFQPGMHPDAESLTAFAEQSLCGAEREEILTHMAVCSRCREVVFLVQQASEAELASPAVMEEKAESEKARAWFGTWRWAWIPVAALAGFVGVAIVQHVRRSEPPQQVAQNASKAEISHAASTAKTVAVPTIQQSVSKHAIRKESLSSSDVQAPPVSRGGQIRDEKKGALEKDQALESTDAMKSVTPAIAGGAFHGTVAARTKSFPFGGPMAQNQVQQNEVSQQNSLQQTQLTARESAANKPEAPPPPTLGAMTQTVAVQAEPVMEAESATLASAPEIAPAAAVGKNSQLRIERLAKAQNPDIVLPSRLSASSSASIGERVVAIDTAGSVFRSSDNGGHWEQVSIQWTGRVVQVKTLQPRSQSSALTKTDGDAPRFDLVNDHQQNWTSTDGKNWAAAPSDK